MAGRTIVVGDIHGCFAELVELLERVELGVTDRVVAVGDLIVKGERNREVLELFINDPRFASVLGNHDLALLRHWRGEAVTLKPVQERARDELRADRERYAGYLASLPAQINLGAHLVVHAGIRPLVPLTEQAIEDLTELRTLGPDRTSRTGLPWYTMYNGPQTVLFGHWPAPDVRRAKYALGLDTGCVYGFQLTAYIIETGEFVQVQARRAYEQPKRPVA
ncbi:MAG: metallophosphatase [Acidobacteria bacterium]|nr:MAG: metallophosphatase [Acidobacteriota bacterium]